MPASSSSSIQCRLGLRRRDRRDRPVDLGAARGAVFARAPLCPLQPVRPAESVAKALPHPGGGGGDGDRPVGGRKHPHRDRGRMIVARLPRHLAGEQPARRLEIEHEHHRLEQARVHPAALARALALEQRHHDGERQEVAGREVADRDADPDRLGAGMAGDAHQAAQALGDLVDAGAMAVRAALAEAGDRGVHDPRVDPPHRLVVDAEPVLHADPHVLDEHVRLLGEAEEDALAFLGLEVEHHRPLVAVQVLVVEAVAIADVAGAVARRLDADHLGAPVGEVPDAGRPGPRDREVEHADPAERQLAGPGSGRCGHVVHRRLSAPQRLAATTGAVSQTAIAQIVDSLLRSA